MNKIEQYIRFIETQQDHFICTTAKLSGIFSVHAYILIIYAEIYYNSYL